MTKKITKLSIFDFDQTLVSSPTPEIGRNIYKEKTGLDWPHQGWWSKPESLDMSIFDIAAYEDVVNAHAKELAAADTAVIMLTGRITKLSQHVEDVLAQKGLKFDEHHYNRGGETGDAKMKTMTKLLEKYTDVTYIEMWDDRDLHIERFRQFGEDLIKSGRLTHFKVNHVNSDHHDPINNC